MPGFAVCLAVWAALPAVAEEPDFSDSILPIVEAKCVACHPASGGQAGLSLTSKAGILRGGSSGPAIVPGKPAESLLMRKVSGEKPEMPPVGEPLSAEEVDLVRSWIAGGAQGDMDASGEPGVGTWWSFRQLSRPAVPQGDAQWARNEVDHFVSAKLANEGLSPSPEAGRATLIRRLSYNLHGLPPDPREVDAFVEDPSAHAYRELVDRLLASPRYGERWGRHWLDVVHYGESHGYDKDKPRRNAWPYRDYVVRSFNEDKPYALFVREQIAGDVLRPGDPEALVATGFIAAGPWDYVGHAELREGTKDKKIARLLDRDDMVAATMSAFNSLTVHCARCHDHKFDPILQADYYSLQAVFAGVDRADQPFFDDPAMHSRVRELWFRMRDAESALVPFEKALADSTSPEIERIEAERKALAIESTDLLPKVGEVDTEATLARRMEIGRLIKGLDDERKRQAISLMEPDAREQYDALTAKLEALKAEFEALPEPRYVYSAATYFTTHGTFSPPWEPRPVHLLHKGSVESPLEAAVPGAVSAVPGLDGRFDLQPEAREGAARTALADWLASPDNPLTWRSIANRLWHYHFGRGIVDSPNDFGRMGAKPSHPELLDWLAAEIRDNGGSIKGLHRKILLSATYRQSAGQSAEKAHTDASNQFLWRMNRTRLDAEAVRDAVLAVTGDLDFSMGGPPAEHFVFIDDHSPIYDYAGFDVASPASRKRSVYRFLVRSVQDPFMESLDCADPSLLVPKRSSTLTAIQALALLNDPLMVHQSRQLAARMRAASGSVAGQIEHGFRLAYGRGASDDEKTELAEVANRHGLENSARIMLNANEFIFVD